MPPRPNACEVYIFKANAGQTKHIQDLKRPLSAPCVTAQLAPVCTRNEIKDQRKGSDWLRVTQEVRSPGFQAVALSRTLKLCPPHPSHLFIHWCVISSFSIDLLLAPGTEDTDDPTKTLPLQNAQFVCGRADGGIQCAQAWGRVTASCMGSLQAPETPYQAHQGNPPSDLGLLPGNPTSFINGS